MKHYFTLITAMAIFALMMPSKGIAQQTYVPDDYFEQELIDLGLDTPPLDDYVPTANIDTLTALYVWEKEISDMTGINDFIALKKLHCYDNSILSLDVSNLTELEQLDCYRNGLTAINLSNCIKLVQLRCYDNALIYLNIDDCTSLEFLDCKINKLISLDVSNCPLIEEVVCIDNELISINTTDCSSLKYLYCYENQLTSLNVSSNIALYDLQCYDNNLVTLNASGCEDLEWLFCNDNALTTIDISNCTSLEWLICYENNLTTLDLSDNTVLYSVLCNNNLLTDLDVSNNTELLQLICHDNSLTSLNIKNGNNPNMRGEIDYPGLDATNNPYLECIQVDDAIASSGYAYWYKDATAMYSEDCGFNAVNESFSESDILIFPIPAKNKFQVAAYGMQTRGITIEIYDLNGKLFFEKNFPAGCETVEIDVRSLVNGVYFCRLSMDGRNVTEKLIIQK